MNLLPLTKCIHETQFARLVHTYWQHFTKNILFFMIKYWLLSSLFLPPFPVLMPLPEQQQQQQQQ